MVVKGNRLVLKILSHENVTQNYLGWMQDEDITQFLECRGKTYALEELKDQKIIRSTNKHATYYFTGR